MPETGGILDKQQERTPVQVFPKATVLHRFIAKSLDVLIVLGVGELAPPYGFWVALWYVLVADGFAGRSIGKRLIGLQTWVPELRAPAALHDAPGLADPAPQGVLARQAAAPAGHSWIRGSSTL